MSGKYPEVAEPSTEEPESRADFNERIKSAPFFFRRLLGPITLLTQGTVEAIGEYIKAGSLLTCSDGGFNPNEGTGCQAWVFADSEGHLLWGSAGPNDGNPEQHSAYRSELGGITIVLYLLQQLVEHLELQAGKVTLRNYLDGIRAVEGVLNGRLNADTILLRVMK
jgi:hypothetical protein